jgi:hypothetical protein
VDDRGGRAETLPAILERRRGIPQRHTLTAAAIVVALGVAAFLLLRDPLQGKAQRVHASAPVFNTLYNADLVHPVKPQGDEYQRYEAHHGKLDIAVTVRPLLLPPYKGDVAGLLPVFTERRIVDLARRYPGFKVLDEGKARVNKAPGYQVGFSYGSRARPGTGRDVFVIPFEKPGVRRGVIISLRQERGPHRPGAAGKALVTAMKSTFRSFKFGSDRND